MGRSLKTFSSLSALWSTNSTYNTHSYIKNCAFSMLRHSIIILVSRSFIWDIKTSNLNISDGEINHWSKMYWTEIHQHGQNLYRKQIKLPSSQNNIFTAKRLRLSNFGGIVRYTSFIQGLWKIIASQLFLKDNEKKRKNQPKEIFSSLLPLIQIFESPPQITTPKDPELYVNFYCFNNPKLSPPNKIIFWALKPNLWVLDLDKSIVDQKIIWSK